MHICIRIIEQSNFPYLLVTNHNYFAYVRLHTILQINKWTRNIFILIFNLYICTYNPIVLFIYMYVTRYYFLSNIAVGIILNLKIIHNNEMLTII